ncbi:MAG: hypothetical protein IKW85_03385 [Muribaculaceae bacterium]|nr:hypothetical protein [Muribaculaceae bacterium]
MMKRLLITLTAAVLVAGSLWAKDEEIIVTRQLTMSQRNALPDKTISVEMKRLAFSKKADPELVAAIFQVMDTIARNDYINRTFVMLIETKADGQVAIAVRDDEIVTRGKQEQGIYYGTLERGRHHFVVLTGKDNAKLLEKTFKRQGKAKFVLEFEFVEFPRPNYRTNVIGQWSPGKHLKLLTVIINEDPYIDRDLFDLPAKAEE